MEDRCIEGIESLGDSLRGCVLTVGNFDGMHIGHQRIVQMVRSLADEVGGPAVAMTFEPPPGVILAPDDPPERISPMDEKKRLLLAAGCDFVVIATADERLLAASPQHFIEDILLPRFAPKHIVEGRNFLFGRRRSGSVETLKAAAKKGGYRVHVAEPVVVDLPDGQQRVSSTLLRTLIRSGRIEDANRCLGRQFTLFGHVVRGAGRGEALVGFPTINVESGRQIVPGDGVYAGRADIDGYRYAAAISVGCSPTFGGTERNVEAFLLDVRRDFYGRDVKLRFVQQIRRQETFAAAETLRAQIVRDVQRVQQIIG